MTSSKFLIQEWLRPKLKLPNRTPKSALPGITTLLNKDNLLTIPINHLLLIFKRFVYEMRFRPVYTNTFSSKTISFSMKKRNDSFASYTSCSNRFHVVYSRLHGNDQND